MRWEKVFEIAREYKREYELLQASGFAGNLREEVARRLGMSVPQGDRYAAFGDLLPDVQNLVRDYDVGMSSLQPICSYSAEEQSEIYDILITAQNHGVRLTREVIKQIVNKYRAGEENWNEIEPDCNVFSHKRLKEQISQGTNSKFVSLEDICQLTGEEFERWFADLLNKNKFYSVRITQRSFDKGVDVLAQKDGIQYIFQCKKTSVTGIKALQEIWFAKRDIHHVAVVVTSGSVSSNARKIAAERGIQCWNGKTLKKLIQNSAMEQ